MHRHASSYLNALRCTIESRTIQLSVRTGSFLQSRSVSSNARTLPKVAQPSIWQSLVPRTLRNRSETASESNQKRAIRIIQLQTEFNTFMRRAELKIGKLREVIEALQKGEEIDVEKVLGTGDEIQEREWEEALKEIENEDRMWQTNKQKRKEDRARAREEAAREATKDTASPVNDAIEQHAKAKDEAQEGRERRPRPPGFY
ncbi:hypothetical protein GJ744_004030 [Endocarpon pusillum]|uniref:Uncharacterized protein n=1 Tax=Endocarpon pusillum TaxID=364733 RepID=A0A8H7A9U7_9EURO|nr:hypothetical protein GJ744_004030 [Endocarpon pusillum]